METRRQLSKIPAVTFAASLLSAAHAAQFSVHLVATTGPTIDGIVDTATDEFRITSWVDSSLTPGYSVPALNQFPISLRAFTATGSLYDVPDAWDGQVGTDAEFAFFLPIGQDLTTVQWIQGQPSSFWRGASFGWGGLRNNGGGIVLRNPLGFSYLPVVSSASSVGDISFNQITVTRLPEPVSIAIRVSQAAQVELCWQTATNTWYQLQYRSTLSANNWLPLSTNWVTGDGTRFCTKDAVVLGSLQKFYGLSIRNSPP